MFQLRTIEPVPGLEDLGTQVQLREQPSGAVLDAMEAGQSKGGRQGTYAVLAASLFVDGVAMGSVEALDALPGRFVPGLIAAAKVCNEIYRFRPAAAPASNGSGEGSDEDHDAEQAPTPGEA